MFQEFIGEIRFTQKPGIDLVFIKKLLTNVRVIPGGDQLQMGKLIDLAFGKTSILRQVFHIHYFFGVGKELLVR